MIGVFLVGVAGAIAAPLIGGLAYRRVRQRRTAVALAIGTGNGIVEETFVRIGGIDQWIQIRAEDRNNPILLVLHGGPGSPYAIFTPLLRSWEKHFTVVQWDRRGVGKTLGRSGKAGAGEMTFDRLVSDGIEVAEFLRRRLQHNKVILLAGSMGTLVGLPMVKRRPDLFSAYVGTDNYVDMARNEAMSYQMTLDRVSTAGNRKAVAALEKIGAVPSAWDVRAWNRKQHWTMKTDPVTPSLQWKLILPLALSSPTYTLRDIVHLSVGFESVKAQLFDQFMAYDARRLGTQFDVPFFLFHGETDVLTLTALAEEYFADVDAPTKALVLLKNAGHFAAFTQPDQFLSELLTRVRPLAAATPGNARTQR